MPKIYIVVAAAAGLVVGYVGGKLSSPDVALAPSAVADAAPASIADHDARALNALREQLVAARAEIDALLARPLASASDRNAPTGPSLSAADERFGDTNETAALANVERSRLFDEAMLALDDGDLAGATRLLNELLASAANPEQKATAQEGLLAVLRSSYEQQRASGGRTNEALWSLFEIHRIAPGPAVKSEIITLSQQAHAEAQNYLAQNDLLASADRLNSLVHLSRMVDYELIDDSGQPLGPAQFQAELQQIEAIDDYLPRLQTRAENNLYGGDEATRSNVFWDYARLATLRGDNSLADPVFSGQFIQATTTHLNYLRDMNQAGEIRSRMDYIRYAFPQIASRPEISSFN